MMSANKSLNFPTHYNKFHILIHWLVVVIILFQMITGDKIALEFLALRNEAITNNGNTSNSQIHVLGGIFIFLLIAIRIFLRIKFGVPIPTKKNKCSIEIFINFCVIGDLLRSFCYSYYRSIGLFNCRCRSGYSSQNSS
tara:strand:+ start:539 stop:955 length:417 start_codon:yes stop_codon:yes gene_type:complete